MLRFWGIASLQLEAKSKFITEKSQRSVGAIDSYVTDTQTQTRVVAVTGCKVTICKERVLAVFGVKSSL